jgi:hypothetical protein
MSFRNLSFSVVYFALLLSSLVIYQYFKMVDEILFNFIVN